VSAQSCLFCYGTLQLGDVFQRVCGEKRLAQTASLADHAAYYLRDQTYPGIRAEAGKRLPGRLYQGIDIRMWQKLDAFEGEEYQRQSVQVFVPGRGGFLEAQIYTLKSGSRSQLTHQPWTLQAFRSRHLTTFLQDSF